MIENLAENNTGLTPRPDGWPITMEALELALAAADPAVRLLVPRVLRRVIRQDAGRTGFAFRVPHRRSYVIGRQRLLEIVDLDELGRSGELLPDTVLLVERPSHEELAVTPAGVMLRRCWRLVFHARVHAVLERSIAEGRLSAADVRRRIEQLGTVEFDEIRNVLGQEHFLLNPDDERAVYVEFAAVYLELQYFAPALAASYFPALEDPAAVGRVLAQDIDAAVVLGGTRPADAAEQEPLEDMEGEAADYVRPDPPSGHGPPAAAAAEKIYRRISPRKFSHYVRQAERAATAGNLVRAAICRARAELCAPRASGPIMHSRMRSDVARLVARLQAVLGFAAADVEPWRNLLLALVRQTPRGFWTVEARLLYDLQKACLDQERPLFTVDPMEWLFSWGARPVKRPLPHQREVLISKHLRSAARRVRAVRVSEGQRHELGRLLRAATQTAEDRLRQRFRPLLAETLTAVGLEPHNLPERVAQRKIVEELLDFIVERGFLTLGELRDAISRNNLKQPDCAGLRDFTHGNALLRADRRLGVTLDGVYQRAEIYLRWIQYFTLAAFGTKTGRFLTRYLAVPFGGAYLVFGGLDHLVKLASGYEPEWKNNPVAVLSLGFLLEGLLHVPWLRQALWRGLKAVFRLGRLLLVDSIRWLLRSPWVQRIVHSRVVVFGYRYLLKPLVATFLVLMLFPPQHAVRQHAAATAGIFLAVNVAINCRMGRNLEEMLTDWIVEGWHRFGVRLLTGLFWLVIDLFRRLLQIIERFLYAVDQWVRFTSGRSRLVLVAKAALGVAWFFVSYVIRFCVTLLIEPQVNPIKHFPVVTVSHKLILPFYKNFTHYLEVHLHMQAIPASLLATSILAGIPGIFGFLVWELWGNWRLFAANRPKGLLPVPIGPHGETMIRLLKPGLHSGTLPKQFAKLRRAHRKALAGGDWKAVRKRAESLERLTLRIRHWLEREFVELLTESAAWNGPPPTVADLHLATNCVRVRLAFPGHEEAALDLEFATLAGWIVAQSALAGPKERFTPAAWHALVTAVIGLFKTGGAELVRQHIEALVPPPPARYDILPQALAVWPDGDDQTEALYDLAGGPAVAPRWIRGYPRRELPTLPRNKLVFREMPIPWNQWVDAWETRTPRV